MRNVITLFLISLVFVGCKNSASTNSEKIDKNSEQPIQVASLEGEIIDLSMQEGKPIFLNLWATWCKPCIAEMPSIEKAANILEQEGYVFMLASDEKVDRINKFLTKYKFDLNFVQMKSNLNELGVLGLPTTIILDKNGKIVFQELGGREWDSEESMTMLRSYL